MGYKYGKSKKTGKTEWGKEENINTVNLRGNSSANEDWSINTRGSDEIYYKTAGNGDRYYIAKSDPTGKTTTWDDEEAMTVAEWNNRQTIEEKPSSSPRVPIGGDSLPPREIAEPPKSNEITYEVTLEEKGGKFTVKQTKEIASPAAAPPRIAGGGSSRLSVSGADRKPAARSRKSRARKSRSRKTRSRRH